MASPQSPSSSAGSGSLYNKEPDLSELVNYFVAAKRSLSSASHVWRANQVVNSARVLLEENAILAAKNTFIRSSVAEQIDVLEALRLGVDEVGQRAHDEFRELLKDLDKADNRLKITLKTLNETPLSRTLQSQSSPQKHLHEFINTDNYTEREQSLHACIDRYNEANRTLQDASDAFEAQLRSLQDSIGAPRTPVPGKSSKPSPLPPLLRALEVHATEIATNLQSLVHHYDLCVTALKHTEGGLPAASLATGEQDLPTAAGISVESLHQDAPPAPMTASERLDMLRVVVKDAAEVDDVVAEMRDRAGDMELQLESMSSHIGQLREEHARLISAVHTLHEMSRDVKGYVDAARVFSASWDEEKEKIIQGYHDFNGLREFFEGFLAAYEDLLVEVARRDKIRQKMADIARDAEKKIAVLYEEDAASRAVFNERQGEFLPVDIWPGLLDPPVRYQVVAAQYHADGAVQAPEAQAVDEASVHGSIDAPPMQKERSRS